LPNSARRRAAAQLETHLRPTMLDLFDTLRHHSFDIIAVAAVLAAILPHASNPASLWGRLRSALDVLGLNVGQARNASPQLRNALTALQALREMQAASKARDDQPGAAQQGDDPTPRQPPTGGPPGGPG
jgi:hypothetical protein